MPRITDEMVAAFGAAWEAKRQEIADGDAAPGTKTRAGLEAVIALSLRSRLRDVIAATLADDIYVCTRDSSAWSYGTMSLDDFQPAAEDEEVVTRIVDATLAEFAAVETQEKGDQ